MIFRLSSDDHQTVINLPGLLLYITLTGISTKLCEQTLSSWLAILWIWPKPSWCRSINRKHMYDTWRSEWICFLSTRMCRNWHQVWWQVFIVQISWFFLLNQVLNHRYVTNNDSLMTPWWLPDHPDTSLMTSWWLTYDSLITHWWLLHDSLITLILPRWLLDDSVMTV